MPPKAPARPAAAARSAGAWLDAESGYRALAARVDHLVALQARLSAACPGVPVTVVCVDERALTLMTPNAAWAGRLRQMTPTLLAHVREARGGVERIRIVPQRRADSGGARAPAMRSALPGSAVAELANLAGEVQAPALRAALERLVRHQRGRR